jgi:hypothetical protein
MVDAAELIQVVTADLRYLKSEWNESVDDDALRRGSTVLRRLLVDGELQRAWKAAGLEKEPVVTCSTLKPILNSERVERIRFAAAGGAHYHGAELRGALMVNYAKTPDQIKSDYEAGLPAEELGLRRFVEAPCIVVAGQLVVRRVLIKYVTNKLGGAHHDRKRGTDYEEQLFVLLDEARAQIRLLDKPAVYFELLAIGQSLASSPDVQRLYERGQSPVNAA